MTRLRKAMAGAAVAAVVAGSGLAGAGVASAAPVPQATEASEEVRPLHWFLSQWWYYDSPAEVPALMEECVEAGERGLAQGRWPGYYCRDNTEERMVVLVVWIGGGWPPG